jgi:ABC-type glycerol-3-phosphate transport system substrate-binding protein
MAIREYQGGKTMKKLLAVLVALTLVLSMSAVAFAAEDGKITIWTWDPNFNIASMKIGAEMYNAEHPDVEIEIQEVASDDIETAVAQAAVAGDLSTLPDIMLCQDNSFQKMVTNYPEVYTDITDKYDFEGFGEAKQAYSIIDGRHYGIPFDAGTVVAAYRTDYLEEAGYTVADLTDITWSQFAEIGKAIKEKTAYDASVVILNPADMFALLTAVDTNKQYLGGGYFFGAYGNGGYKTPNALWGVPVFESADVTAGSALICAKQAVNVWQKGGVDVKLYEQNEDDAIYNRVTLLAEERIACAVKDLNGVYLLEAE